MLNKNLKMIVLFLIIIIILLYIDIIMIINYYLGITLLRLLSWENEPEILFDTEKKKCIHVSHIKKYGIKSTMKGRIHFIYSFY